MNCGTLESVKFRERLGFAQHDIIMIKEKSMLTKIMERFSSEIVLIFGCV